MAEKSFFCYPSLFILEEKAGKKKLSFIFYVGNSDLSGPFSTRSMHDFFSSSQQIKELIESGPIESG
jgi:hypothetical protein